MSGHMRFEAADGAFGRRTTAIGVAPQDLRQRCRAPGKRLAVGERPAMQPLGHDLDPAPDA